MSISGMHGRRSSIGRRRRTFSRTPFRCRRSPLIESIKPNKCGWFFPSAKNPPKPESHGTLFSFVWRRRDRGVIPYATNRDLRRTFKTLAGKAGVSKEIRDRPQNHALQDVNSKNYIAGITCPRSAPEWQSGTSTCVAAGVERRSADSCQTAGVQSVSIRRICT